MGERIIANDKEANDFIAEQVAAIKTEVQQEKAICFVSGGVDSSVVAVLGQRALGENLQVIFVDNGLMREGEPEEVREFFSKLEIPVQIVDKAEQFLSALRGRIYPLEKRHAIRTTFYRCVLPQVAHISDLFGAKFLLQGTNLTDIEATTKDSKAPQHNVLSQIGFKIFPGRGEEGIEVIEPLTQLRKRSIRAVARELGLPAAICDRMPFPGPALAARILGEVTPEKVAIIRRVTAIVEEELAECGAFQYFPVLVSDIVPSANRRELGYAIAIVCVKSEDAVTAKQSDINSVLKMCIRDRIYREVPEVLRVCWDYSTKPPSAIEWV